MTREGSEDFRTSGIFPLISPYPFGAVAQLVERLLCKQDVVGSSPFGSTIFYRWAFSIGFSQAGSTGSGRLFGNWPRVRLLHRRACEGKKQTSIKQREPGTLGTDVPDVPSQGHGTGFVRSPVRPGAGIWRPGCTGAWRMPWRRQAKKDAASCEKPRGDACGL